MDEYLYTGVDNTKDYEKLVNSITAKRSARLPRQIAETEQRNSSHHDRAGRKQIKIL